MSPWHSAIAGGLLYSVPFGIWLLGGLEPAAEPPSLESAHRALLWTQVVVLVLLLPALVHRPLRRSVAALLLLQAVPWPLLVLFVLTGSVPLGLVLAAQGAVALGGVTVALLWHLTTWSTAPWQRPSQAALRGLTLLGLIYATHIASAGLG